MSAPRMTRRSRLASPVQLTGVLALVLLGATGRALASPSYNGVVQRTFDLPCAPSCLLCHTDEQGGFATANTKLGITLRRELAAECCDDEALADSLAQLASAAADSDGDGTSDGDELLAFRDPNLADSSEQPQQLTCRPAAESGCNLRRTGQPALWSGAWLLLLAALGVHRYLRRA